MDKAVVVSFVATAVAIAALGTTTWLSFRIAGAVRVREQAAFDQYRTEAERNAARIAQEAEAARQRMRELERAAAAADARAGQAANDSATATAKARSAEINAEEVRKRVEELGRAVMAARAREAAAREPAAGETAAGDAKPREMTAAEPSQPASPTALPSTAPAPSPVVASLARHTGSSAAIFVLDEARDGNEVGATIGGYLREAGWRESTWTWSGVSGIFGVVVLLKDGSDAATTEAASSVVESLRAAGFNATKGDWPAAWGRYRGTLSGPAAPGPADAPIRIVVGSKAR